MRNLAAAALLLAGCYGATSPDLPLPIEGSTYRIGPYIPTDGSEVTIEIFRDRKRCEAFFRNEATLGPEFGTNADRIDACIPRVDRQNGAVHMSFRLADAARINKAIMLPIEKEHIALTHSSTQVSAFEFTPHEPQVAGQLFIVVVDHSSSMWEEDASGVTRMARVRAALKANAKTFISDKSAVALLRFTDEVAGFDGRPWYEVPVIQRRREYQAEIENIGGAMGWTHMYNAVRITTSNLLEDERSQVAQFLRGHDMEPTVILLTDGFNNTSSREKCSDNVGPLGATLRSVREARRKKPSERPTLYTVGFGSPVFKGKKPPVDSIDVSAPTLCHAYVDSPIDGNLDNVGVDNLSLRWLAQAGGGKAFILQDHRELTKAFEQTAPERYSWYELDYRVDGFHHRQAFEPRIKLLQFARSQTQIKVYPSAWLDAPTGAIEEGGRRVIITPLRHAAVVLMPILGLLMTLSFMGAATFNGRRAIFRRARRRRKS
jgi:hypothetical protein